MQNHATSVRLTNTLFITQSLFTAAQTAVVTLLTVIAVQISGRESLAGVPTTVATLSQAAMAMPIGILMGRFGRRLGLSTSYGTSALGAVIGIVAILQSSFMLLVVSVMVIGVGRAGAEQSRYAAGDIFPDGLRARMIGRVVFAGTVGAVFSIGLFMLNSRLTAVSATNASAGLWAIAAVVYAVAAVLIFLFLRPEPLTIAAQINREEQEQAATAQVPQEPEHTVGEMLQMPPVRLAIVAMLISQTTMVALMVMTPLHMAHHNYGDVSISIVQVTHVLGMFGLSSLTGYLIDRYGEVNTMIAGAFTLILSAIIAPMSSRMPFLLIGLFLLGLGWNFGYIAGSSMLSKALRGAGRSRMQGMSDMFVAGAAAFGSLFAGPVYGYGGYVAVAGMVVVLTLLLGYVIFLLGGRVRRVVPAAASS
ncbi:MAG: MFS transporter [Chloroflexota bacterium]